MATKIVKLPNAATALDTIVRDIAQLATDMVSGALTIGQRLIEAREILGDDAAFGAWRKEHIEPLGISTRTAQRFANIAQKFTADTLPQVGLSVLYVLASDSVQPQMQEALIERAAVGAQAGQPLTAREANLWVSKLNNGRATFVDVRAESAALSKAAKLAPVELPGFIEPEQVARAEAALADRLAGPLAGAPRALRDWDGEAKEFAGNVRRKLKAVPESHRSTFLFELKQELVRAGLLGIGEGITVQCNGQLTFTTG